MPKSVSVYSGRASAERVDAFLAECGRYLVQGALYVPFAESLRPRFSPSTPQFCRRCLEGAGTGSYCRRSIMSAAFQALQIGEPYYFRCWSGLNTVVFPVASGRTLVGAFETGAFHYPGDRADDAVFVSDNLGNACPGSRTDLIALMAGISELSPLEIRGMASFIFEGLFSCGVNDVDVFREFHEKYLQQRRIGELMQADGDRVVAENDLFDLFPALSRTLRSRDSRQLMLLMDGFFSRIMLSTGLNVDAMKAHIHLLLAFLARESVTQGRQSLDRAVTRHFQHFRELDDLSELEDICYWTSVRVRRYVESLGEAQESEQSISDRVIDWVDANFWRKVTLADVARQVGASVSGIVHALRRDTGHTFHAHLLAARVQEARRLLAETDETLAAVALRCGFCDQSHFTRAFKAQAGLAPGRYRNLARKGLRTAAR